MKKGVYILIVYKTFYLIFSEKKKNIYDFWSNGMYKRKQAALLITKNDDSNG